MGEFSLFGIGFSLISLKNGVDYSRIINYKSNKTNDLVTTVCYSNLTKGGF